MTGVNNHMMTDAENLAEFILQRGQDALPYESILEEVAQANVKPDISWESTEDGRAEFGRLIRMTRDRLLIENPAERNRTSGKSRKHDGRALPPRRAAYWRFAEIIEAGTGVQLSGDVIRKAEKGEDVNDKTLFKLATAQVIIHPGLERAMTTQEMIDVLRGDLTINDMKAMREEKVSGEQKESDVLEDAPKGSRRTRKRGGSPS